MKLELKIDIDEINYAQLIRAIIPYIKREDIPLPEKVLSAAETPGVLENFLKFRISHLKSVSRRSFRFKSINFLGNARKENFYE